MAALEEVNPGSGSEAEYPNGVRSVELHLPEDEGEGLGFQLTRTLWDPYPWVREVSAGSRAADAGLRVGDCLLQVDGQDLLGITVGKVAGMIRGDGAGRVVSLLMWNCGVDPADDPELLWSGGGGRRGERARRVVAAALRALACVVCSATVRRARSCARGHLYCHACWVRLQRCAVCREPLPRADHLARNLLAEQIYEAIATEYGIKDPLPPSASSPRASPLPSPVPRRPQYQISLHRNKRTVHFDRTNYASDPNIHRTSTSTVTGESSREKCSCGGSEGEREEVGEGSRLKAVPRRLVDLRAGCVSRSLNSIHVLGDCCSGIHHSSSSAGANHSSSLDNLKTADILSQDTPLYIIPAPPVYLLRCAHDAP